MSSNMAAPLPGRCAFFVEKKKRYCKMVVGRGKKFCGEHATMVSSRTRADHDDTEVTDADLLVPVSRRREPTATDG